MPAIHPKKERQRIWRDKGDRRRVHARPGGSLCRFAKNRVYRRNLCCIPRAAKTAAVKEIDAAPMSAIPPIADIGTQSCDVRFVPKADISLLPDGTLSRTVYRHLEGAILIHAEQVSRIVALLGAVNSGLANQKHQLVIIVT